MEYHHFAPEFKDAHEHNPDGITLLCDPHHKEATKGTLSVDQVANQNNRPFARTHGANKAMRQWRSPQPLLVVGARPSSATIHLNLPPNIIRRAILDKNDMVVLGVEPPEAAGGPVRITANIWDETGELILSIWENELQTHGTPFDVRQESNLLTVRSCHGIVLQLREHGEGELQVVELHSKLPSGALLHIENGTLVMAAGQMVSISAGCSFDYVRLTPEGGFAAG